MEVATTRILIRTRSVFFYTILLEEDSDIVVDIMVSEESTVVYPMQNGDGSTVYHGNLGNEDGTLPDYEYDVDKASSMVIEAYEKEFGEIDWL